nr:leucine-rich repeat protein 1-like [Coffea arabica]
MTTLEQAKLSNNQLKSDVSAIKLPDGLSSIDLHSNQLYGSLSSILSNKTSKFLEVVDISNNQISSTIPEFSNSLNLKVLNIASNKLTGGTIPTSLGLLLKLQWLDLSINTLSRKILDSLLQIEALRHTSFRANRLCGPCHLLRERSDRKGWASTMLTRSMRMIQLLKPS